VNIIHFKAQRLQLLKRHKALERSCDTRPHHLSIVKMGNKRELDAFDKRIADELHRFDIKIVNEIDRKMEEQQEIMSQAGVPGFFVTKTKSDIQKQISILELIRKIKKD
jgi:hypothetical protein